MIKTIRSHWSISSVGSARYNSKKNQVSAHHPHHIYNFLRFAIFDIFYFLEKSFWLKKNVGFKYFRLIDIFGSILTARFLIRTKYFTAMRPGKINSIKLESEVLFLAR